MQRLVVAISSRALFDLGDSHELFEREGLDSYARYQMAHEDELLAPGIAFPLVQKLLRLNSLAPEAPRVEVILLSRNSADTGLRIFNSIEHYGLDIVRAAFTNGAPTASYAHPFGANLFLSANVDDVRRALTAGVAAATILPSKAPELPSEQLRIAFDGDAVIFGDDSERVSHHDGIEAFHKNEIERVNEPLAVGPFRSFLEALHRIQDAFPIENSPIRTALVTARSAPAHKRVILTLRN
ncbi:MAG TPA: 5'-nucleotidase, partial [Dokdonella sp.]|nr:5'-nucleotidase [Dokdonella sp.]